MGVAARAIAHLFLLFLDTCLGAALRVRVYLIVCVWACDRMCVYVVV